MSLLETIDRWGAVAPNAIAHISDARTLTYGELRERSEALAMNLLERFGDHRSPVAVLGHREPEMLIAFLGAVKSGRPYIPLDTALPQTRIARIVTLSRASTLLTPKEISRLSESANRSQIAQLQRDYPFYILFTSGSTGEPKGVEITLGCLEHFVSWMLAEQNFVQQGEIFLNQAPFSFDLSVMDLYCSLATGGTLFSVNRDLVSNPKLLYRALANSNITTWVSTPSFVKMCLVESTFDSAMLPHLRRFLFCGEILPPRVVSQLFERFPNATVWNTYGPTEATVATTSIRITPEILQKYSTLPVGRAMSGTDVVVLGDSCVAKPNETGEIVIAGPNVSPGYLGQPDLTREAFFNFRGRRAYHTGDRGRICDDLLFFEGRMDRQLKLNGYRIELGDVEENLRQLPKVRDAVVLPMMKNGGAQSLAAFVVCSAKSSGAFDFEAATSLRNELAERLPIYMLPRKFIFIDTIPMTVNGKADRNALAALL